MNLRTLMYHDIVSAGPRHRYAFTRDEFKDHLAAIRASVSAAPAVARSHEGALSGFAISFDDGHEGWLAAADDLEALGWRAFFFVTTGEIGRPGRIDAAGLRRLDAAGHVVGTHSVDHPEWLAQRDFGYIRSQWSGSKASLEDILGRQVLCGAVPGGSYRKRVGLAADAAGLRLLFTSEPVSTPWQAGNCRVLGRFTLTRGMKAQTAGALAAGKFGSCARQYLSWNLRKGIKAALPRSSYLALRRALTG